jgi:cytochrome c-type biogenesis protein CcmH/NrfG
MTELVIIGGLTFIVALLILRPFSLMTGRMHLRAHSPDNERRRELLRQLRDLDDDFATGKLTLDDHVRLRDPLEREAAGVLHRTPRDAPSGTPALPSSTRSASTTSGPSPRRNSVGGSRRWRRRTVLLLALAGAAGSVTILLVGAVSARHAGQTITGNSVAGNLSASGSTFQSGQKSATPGQLAAVAAAEAEVRKHPKDVSAHLTLADAYAAAGASQLAAVEYLAVIRIDPMNAEANTNLALLAFEVGQAAEGKAMVDRVLAADPSYPEALYVRGLINLVGLQQPAAAERDLSAYLAVAPFGSHRAAAATLLALAQSQDHR